MHNPIKRLLSSVFFAFMATGFTLPAPAPAQTYPIDCAILLCLSGGWPASLPCARARAEFILRITPWPVEPPLQIWRCPMGASYGTTRASDSADRIFEAFLRHNGTGPRQSFLARDAADPFKTAWRTAEVPTDFIPVDWMLRLSQNRSDIDISGPEFNFVRSIRVFNVKYARQRESGRDGECNRRATVVLGSYGTQGEFSWHGSSISALPSAHVGLERWGEHCPNLYHRSIFVDWRDYQGSYGFEQVEY